MIVAYIAYFGTFSVLKFRHLYAGYFDLGIMHHTVYNSYMALRTGDLSRVLELTTPHGGIDQVKRMAIHNDIILFFLAPFYFIHAGPETLLIIQTVVLALGAWAVFKISQQVIKNDLVSLVFAFAYLMYAPMQRANIFEFHAVTIATTSLLYMFYFWLKGRNKLMLLFLIISLLTKEEVGLTLGMFGVGLMVREIFRSRTTPLTWRDFRLPAFVGALSWIWSLLSVFWIIPHFRDGEHFAMGYYHNSFDTFKSYIFSFDTVRYLFYLLGPLAFFGIFAPEFLLIAAPELGINLLSSNLQLRSFIFHYTSVLQPWMFIGAIYGVRRLFRGRIGKSAIYLSSIIILASLAFNYLQGPLPFDRDKNVDALLYDRNVEYQVVARWADRLSSDSIKVAATDEIAPFFTSRRYFYIFSHTYTAADYVIVGLANIQYTYRNDVTIPAYEELEDDPRFEKVDEQWGYEIYKKRI
jgi:uncharacterized membrane protein